MLPEALPGAPAEPGITAHDRVVLVPALVRSICPVGVLPVVKLMSLLLLVASSLLDRTVNGSLKLGDLPWRVLTRAVSLDAPDSLVVESVAT